MAESRIARLYIVQRSLAEYERIIVSTATVWRCRPNSGMISPLRVLRQCKVCKAFNVYIWPGLSLSYSALSQLLYTSRITEGLQVGPYVTMSSMRDRVPDKICKWRINQLFSSLQHIARLRSNASRQLGFDAIVVSYEKDYWTSLKT